MTAWVEHYPIPMHPVVDVDGALVADTTRTVDGFALRNGDQDRLATWAGLPHYLGVDGGILLIGGPTAEGRLPGQVRLGDLVVRHPDGALETVPGETNTYHRYRPA